MDLYSYRSSLRWINEERIKHYLETPTLLSRFNRITGISTGGITPLAFATAKKDPVQGRRMYFQLKDEILGDKPPILKRFSVKIQK